MTSNTPLFRGLSGQEAAARLQSDGCNELPSTQPRGLLRIAWGVVYEPMFLLLVAGGAIYLALGNAQEAALLLGSVFVIIGITLYQERRTERALTALRDLTSPRALVIRDGTRQRIAGREVVRDDLVVLTEGDRVPADGVVLSCHDLAVDESLLTGESLPVHKRVWDGNLAADRPGGDDRPFMYSGTVVVQGQGIVQVQATGAHTELGKIGRALQSVTPEITPLQQDTRRLVRTVAAIGMSLCVIVVLLYGFTRADWLNGVLAGIALAMSLVPEEFPVVLTVFLALGAWRMAQHRVLTRRVPVVETLGAATVLCVDKTGTLTENRMAIRTLVVSDVIYRIDEHDPGDLPEPCHELVEFSILASETSPYDPMEQAFQRLGVRYLTQTEHLHKDWTLVQEYSLSADLLAVSHVWKSATRGEYVVATKGAPEAIANLCHFDAEQQHELSTRVNVLANEGLRVLGVAKASFRGTAWPAEQHTFDFTFLGLVGLADPVRPTVPAAIQECRTAGIRVVMITGDYPGTAQAIARQIDVTPAEEILTGDEMDHLSDTQLRQRITTVNIFARVVPEQKLRLVTAFKAQGEIVAMTGDGVNDAPALKAAHIGIAMGKRGTDVAREAAALVLLDDDFASIVEAVKLGRRIFDNLQKAMAYIFAIHVPIAGVALLPLVLHWPLIFAPVHIVFLELIIDPACSIAFEGEPAEANVMQRPPRAASARLFAGWTLGLSLLQGIVILLLVLAVFVIALYRGQGDLEARSLTFTTLVIANLSLIFANRSWSRMSVMTLGVRNVALWWVVASATVALSAVLTIPGLRAVFHFAPLHLNDVAVCLAVGLSSVLWFDVVKWLRR